MSNQIDKELALKIVKKLKATKVSTRNTNHDQYEVAEGTTTIGYISIRRGSGKSLGHDHIPQELHINTFQAKNLGYCPWKRKDFIKHMREIGELPPEEDDNEASEESDA